MSGLSIPPGLFPLFTALQRVESDGWGSAGHPEEPAVGEVPCARVRSWLQGHAEAGLQGQGTVLWGTGEVAAAAQEVAAAHQVHQRALPSVCALRTGRLGAATSRARRLPASAARIEETGQNVSPDSGVAGHSEDRDTNTSNDPQLPGVKLKNPV